MGWFSGIILYILIWWVTLFAMLPIGTEPRAEADATSGWRGAPRQPRLGRKLLMTTVVSAVVWGAVALVITSDYLSFRHGILAPAQE
jgi:predicted secreted protein